MAPDLITRIVSWLKRYKEMTNCKGVVIGISGGKDSTVVAMLAKKVWGDNVFGVMMPNGNQSDLSDSVAICSAIGIESAIVNIGEITSGLVQTINSTVQNINVSQKSITNIAPRMRMTTLYAIAQTMGYRVIGTGNASEAYIGWTTKWGDSAYDLNPIYNLTCSEVVELGLELAKEFNLPEHYITKKPSDGLTGRTDEDNFGFTYDELDAFIRSHDTIPTETAEKIRHLHDISNHKRSMPHVFNPNIANGKEIADNVGFYHASGMFY